jgi:hypothetical protein
MVRKLKRGTKQRLVVFLVVVCLFLVAMSLYLSFSKPVAIKEFDVFFTVDRSILAGVDVGADALRFGNVGPGSIVKRNVDITNSYDFPLEVKVLLSKDLVSLIDTEGSFIVYPMENKTIPVKLIIPLNLEDGNYTGKIKFEMYKVD